jgi:hypothetical protein
MFLDHFDALLSKIIFKNKKNYFDIFLNEKYFKKTTATTLPNIFHTTF